MIKHADLYDELLLDPLVRAFHGGAWYNVGLWDGCERADDASANLVATLVRPADPPPGDVLDVGCGIGGSTGALARAWPAARLTGIGMSERQLAQARKACPGASFLCADAVALPFGAGTFDAVVAVESALHFRTRADFFAEAWRVLRPGGLLLLADLSPRTGDWPGGWTVPPANIGWSCADYQAALNRAGFADAAVRDVTEQSWQPYIARFRQFVAARSDAGERDRWGPAVAALATAEAPLYVIASARRTAS